MATWSIAHLSETRGTKIYTDLILLISEQLIKLKSKHFYLTE